MGMGLAGGVRVIMAVGTGRGPLGAGNSWAAGTQGAAGVSRATGERGEGARAPGPFPCLLLTPCLS